MSACLIKLPNNSYSIQYQQKYLHSLKNPHREAERLVLFQLQQARATERISDKRSPLFFLLNPGLGHAAATVRKYYPLAQICAVYSDKVLYDFVKSCDHALFAAKEMLLSAETTHFRHYLLSNLNGLSIFAVQLIDWLPASHLSGHSRLLAEYLSAMREIQAGLLTRMFFGKRWIANTSRNIQDTHRKRRIKAVVGPVVICASGPSLADRISLLREIRSQVHIWALPSSIRALLEGGIIPDCVISSDGGYWAGRHLVYAPPQSHIIMALSAQVPASVSQRWKSWEFVSLQMPFMQRPQSEYCMELPERASVIFTALDILSRIGRGPVLLFGADFRTRGLQTHVRPHSFDELIESSGNRLNPLSTLWFTRSSGEQLHIYADWFTARGSDNWPSLYRWRGDGRPLPINELQTRAEVDAVIAASPPVKLEWKDNTSSPQNLAENIFVPIPRPLPNNLFSGREHLSLLEILIFMDGIGLKRQYLHWLGGKDEAQCIREFDDSPPVMPISYSTGRSV